MCSAIPGPHLYSISRIAHLLGLHLHTVRNYLKRNKVHYSFSDISDEDLDHLVKTYCKQKPESGIWYLVGFLHANGQHMAITRTRASIARVDPVGHILCQRARIIHRSYKVRRPNALWHMDGHHKLVFADIAAPQEFVEIMGVRIRRSLFS